MSKVEINVTMKLRQAVKSDFWDPAKGYLYRRNVIYFVRSGVTGQIAPYPYFLTPDTDKQELAEFFRFKQLFVPARYLEDCIVELKPVQSQSA